MNSLFFGLDNENEKNKNLFKLNYLHDLSLSRAVFLEG